MRLSKLNLSSLPFLVLYSFLFVLGASILSSCGSKKHSVREMRAAKAPHIPRPQQRAMIQPLFLQSKKANISLPGTGISGGIGGSIVSEQVTYRNADNNSDLFESNSLDPNKTYGLSEVVVEARSRFTPERDGKISVDFVIKVPKELIDRNWSMRLQPVILGKDSIQKLDHIVIKGQQFALKQKLDYQAYDDYLNSIVAKEDYDSVFLNHQAIEDDIRSRQEDYYDLYHQNWALRKEYEDWLIEQKHKDAEEKALLKGQLAEMKYDYMRKLLTHAVRDISRGVDTTGLAASYSMEYLKKSSGIQKRLDRKETGEMDIPKKYREVHAMKSKSSEVENLTMSSQDTLDIAKTRYFFDAIIENEMKDARKELVKAEMIPFPYDAKARIDTTVVVGQNFAYYYRQELPVTPGLRSVNIAMETQVLAIDESRFTMRKSDTLSYFISSIVQLVDTALLNKETTRLRNAFHRETAYFKYRPNTWKFDANYKDNATQLATITKAYNTFDDSKGFAVDSIIMQASTSLDGTYQKNAELSMKRIEDLKTYLVKSTAMGKSRGADIFKTNYIGEDWNSLVRLLRASNDLENKDQIISILGNTTDPDATKEDLKSLYKADYLVMQETIFPKLDKVDFLFNVHRTDMTNDKEIITVDPEYRKGVRLLQDRQYDKAMEILANYPDYNAAVCLAALGYNAKGYEVLAKQKANGNTEYLSAILAWRMGQEQVAINHLMKSIELDESKLFRLGLDPDVNDMIAKHKLQNRINQIHQ